jgi:hypothetical protein
MRSRGTHAATVRKDRIMAQQHKIGTHATTISRIDGRIIVTYHSTPVVTVDADGTITLNSGGWRSATTKIRINQVANQFGLRFRVHQRDFQWWLRVDGPDDDDLRLDADSPVGGRGCQAMTFSDGIRFRVYRTA